MRWLKLAVPAAPWLPFFRQQYKKKICLCSLFRNWGWGSFRASKAFSGGVGVSVIGVGDVVVFVVGVEVGIGVVLVVVVFIVV